MLTVDFERLDIKPGDRVIDIGAGRGRHTFEALRRGAEVTALDHNGEDLALVSAEIAQLQESGQLPADARAHVTTGDALALPFADDHFDVVIISEVLEHLPDDRSAMREVARVLKPGGKVAVSVPRSWPERLMWLLSSDYHLVEGGHVRIYTRAKLVQRLRDAGLKITGSDAAHALHTPYWLLKCLVGVHNDEHRLVKRYHDFLVWDLFRRPMITRMIEKVFNPIFGKSVNYYLTR